MTKKVKILFFFIKIFDKDKFVIHSKYPNRFIMLYYYIWI